MARGVEAKFCEGVAGSVFMWVAALCHRKNTRNHKTYFSGVASIIS